MKIHSFNTKRLLLIVGTFALAISLFIIGFIYFYLNPRLPSIETLKHIELQVPLRVFSKDGKLIGEFGEKRRTPVAYKDTPELLVKAVLAAEDDRFFKHSGVDYAGLIRAMVMLVLTGEKTQGGSTITMQVARNFFLSSEKTYSRKINEILLSFKIEHGLSKEEILELYLNKIFLGNRAYGFGAAAQVYYGKSLQQLDIAQIAMIAGLPKAPSRFNPIINPTRALERRNYVLRRMKELGYINQQQYDASLLERDEARLHGTVVEVEAPYVAEMVRAEVIKLYGEEAYTNGVKAYATIDANMQQAANEALLRSLAEYDQRHGYRGPLTHVELPENGTPDDWYHILASQPSSAGLSTALVVGFEGKNAKLYTIEQGAITLPWKGINWARGYRKGKPAVDAAGVIKAGDIILAMKSDAHWRLAQAPQIEGALVAMSPRNGAILALCGGYDFQKSMFNRATQSQRQPGSSFKPFIYTAALEKGYTPASIINDAPIVFENGGQENAWRPENYSGEFYGPTRLRVALAHSRNLVSIRLLQDIGLNYAVNYVTRFGFNPKQIPNNLSAALGSGSATPLQLAQAYSIFANTGYKVDSYILDRIEEHDGRVFYQADPAIACPECDIIYNPEPVPTDDAIQSADANTGAITTAPVAPQINAAELPRRRALRVISPQISYEINTMLKDVITYGTASSANSLGRNDLRGKTGTTNDQRDAWFSGFNEGIVATVWVGYDKPQPLGGGETGSRLALPMWIYFMQKVLHGIPSKPLAVPPGMVTVAFNPQTGKPALPGSNDAVYETIPQEFAPVTEEAGAEAPSEQIPEDLF